MINLLHKLIAENREYILNEMVLPGYVKKTVASIVNCRTMELGGHIYICPDLHGGLFHYNSCKKRGCPICMEYEQYLWYLNQKDTIPPTEHSHIIFKMPSELSTLWLYNKYQVQTILFDASKSAIKKISREENITRGWMTALHTAGNDLSYHPHLHTLMGVGGFTLDEQVWHSSDVKIDNLRCYYEKKIKKDLLKEINKNALTIPPEWKNGKIIKIIEEGEFPIHQAGVYSNGEGVLKYLSKKLKTGAINTKQILSYDGNDVIFYYKQGKRKEKVKLSKEEFLKRFLNHIPLKGFKMIRCYGLYSSWQKGKARKLVEKATGVRSSSVEKKEENKFKCPVCGKELSIVKRYESKEFMNLFIKMRKDNPDKPPPGHGEFERFDINILEK